MKLSRPMKKMLENLAKGLSPSDHCRTQSEYGGAESTMRALVVRGLMDWEGQITESGRRFLETGKAGD